MDLTEEQVKSLEEVFEQNLPPNKQSLTLKEFKKIMPSKNVRIRINRIVKKICLYKKVQLYIFNFTTYRV